MHYESVPSAPSKINRGRQTGESPTYDQNLSKCWLRHVAFFGSCKKLCEGSV